MNKMIVGVIILVAIIGFFIMQGNKATAPVTTNQVKDQLKNQTKDTTYATRDTGDAASDAVDKASGTMQETMENMHEEGGAMDKADKAMDTMMGTVDKNFVMTAYYDDKGKWFSLKEMNVKKGDTVRIKITNTKGMHDFTLDEFGIKKELPLNEEVVIEFVADKVGDFEYYCSKMDHRAKGQWGTLKVTE